MTLTGTWSGELKQRCLQALFDENPDAVFVFDTEGRHLVANGVLEGRTGLPWEQLRRMDFVPTVHPDDRERVEAEFAAALEGSAPRRYRARGVRPDGSTYHADVLNVPIRIGGDVVAVLGVARDIDELAGVRESLDRTTGLIRIAGRIARIGGWAVDLETGERYWSDEMYRLLKLPDREVPAEGRTLERLQPPDRDALVAEYARCVAEGTAFDVPGRYLLPDGSVMHARIVGEAVRDDAGRIIGVEGALIDITAEVEARQERQTLEARVVAALDGIGDAMAFVDSEWRLTFLNARAERILGGGRQGLVGTSLWELSLPDPEGVAMLHEAMSTRRMLVHRRFDESAQRWMEISAFPAGDLLGLQVRDVTEMEDARRRLIDDTRRINAQTALLDSGSDAIIMRGLGDSIEYANPATSVLLGTGDADLRGSSLRELLGMELELYEEAEASVGRSGGWQHDLHIQRPDGSERLVECHWRVVNDPGGNADAVFCVLTDVTERRRQDELLWRTQRMESIGTLASGIAHDLNNVLTPLMLSTQLLAASETDPQRARILEGMRQTVERGADMIRQVLTFARGVEGERTNVDIADLAERFAGFCRDILPKDIEVEVEVDGDLVVLGDRTQLMQVLMNLATNARDAMPTGGHLSLRATGDGERVTIEVTDDGVGMSPAVLALIFEPFYTTKGIGRGTGLGLPVSQAIARTHGGSLEASSTPGSGTAFRLELPRIAPAELPASEADEHSGPTPLTGLRVLILDDEDDIVELASLVIDHAGGIPSGAHDVETAKEVLARTEVDVVLSDLVMPGTSGREFLDWLTVAHPALPVVAMSGVPEQSAHAARRANVRSTLDKPFSPERLLAALRQATDAGTP